MKRMQIDAAILLGIAVVVLLLSFLKAEKLVKITFGSYVLLVFCTGLGICILQWAAQLQGNGNQEILGISYSSMGEFLINAQPTIMLVMYLLGLWFFAVNSHLTIQFSGEMFEKKIQTLLRGILAVGSILSAVYFSLAYFKGDIYELFFNNSYVIGYTPLIPIVSLISALITILAASHLNLKIALKISDGGSNT